MKKLPTSCFLVLLLPALTLAAQVFGSLRLKGASVGANVEIVVKCPDQKPPLTIQAKTDRYGAYSVYVRGSAKCELTVKYDGKQSKPSIVYADRTDPVRYDFELIDENGALILRRR